jgi:hypothetical protein
MLRSAVFGFVLAATAATSGCVPTPAATTFSGSAVIDGPQQCVNMCERNRLAFAGMVFMGEYSSGCICRAPESGSATNEGAAAFAVAAAPAAIGVVMQMRAAAEAEAEEQLRRNEDDLQRQRQEQEETDRRLRESLGL